MTVIIPLGEECYTCGSIDSKFNCSIKNVRITAFPFDYVGHVFIETILAKSKELFENPMAPPLLSGDLQPVQFGDNYFFSDKKFNFHYWHDTSHSQLSQFTHEEFITIEDKYTRRYNRFRDLVLSQTPLTFISVNHFDNIYYKKMKKECLIELFEFLLSLNPNIRFIAFNFEDNKFIHKTLFHYTIIINREAPFDVAKTEFTSILNKEMQLLI